MLGFSLQKLIALAAVVALAWYGLRWLSRYQQVRRDREKDRLDRARRTPPEPAGEDLEQCPRCGAFVPAGAPHECA